jgi:hypothetical protein
LHGHPINVRRFDNRQDGGEHIENLQDSKISQRCQEQVTPIAYCALNFNAKLQCEYQLCVVSGRSKDDQ